MKFTDYLQDIQSTQLSSETKELIFRRFEAKKSQKGFFARVTNYSRVATLSLVAVGLLGVLYFSNFGGQESGEWKADDGLLVFNADPAQPITYADEIGTIIQTVGEVTITSNGEIKETGNLVSSDKVLLLEGAEMTFSVQDGVQAKIVGPAEFEVEKAGEIYVINMLSGEFVELKSIDPVQDMVEDEPTPTVDPSPKKVLQPKKSVQVVVKTPEFEISSNTDDGEIDVTITTQDDGKQLVENTGAELTITRVIKDQSVVTELKAQQTASINGQVTIADIVASDPQIALNEEQAEELVATLKEDLTISYKIDEDNKSNDTTTTQEPQKSTILAQAPVEEVADPAPETQLPNNGDDIVRNVEVNQVNIDQSIGDTADLDTTIPISDTTVGDLPTAVKELVEDGNNKSVSNNAETTKAEDIPTPTKRVIGGNDLIALQGATNAGGLMTNIRTIVTNYAHGNMSASSNGLVGLTNTLSPISNNLLGGVYLDRSSPVGLANSLQTMITSLETKRFIPPVYINKIKGTVARLRLIQTIPSGGVDPLCDFNCIVDEVLEVPAGQRGYLMM